MHTSIKFPVLYDFSCACNIFSSSLCMQESHNKCCVVLKKLHIPVKAYIINTGWQDHRQHKYPDFSNHQQTNRRKLPLILVLAKYMEGNLVVQTKTLVTEFILQSESTIYCFNRQDYGKVTPLYFNYWSTSNSFPLAIRLPKLSTTIHYICVISRFSFFSDKCNLALLHKCARSLAETESDLATCLSINIFFVMCIILMISIGINKISSNFSG